MRIAGYAIVQAWLFRVLMKKKLVKLRLAKPTANASMLVEGTPLHNSVCFLFI